MEERIIITLHDVLWPVDLDLVCELNEDDQVVPVAVAGICPMGADIEDIEFDDEDYEDLDEAWDADAEEEDAEEEEDLDEDEEDLDDWADDEDEVELGEEDEDFEDEDGFCYVDEDGFLIPLDELDGFSIVEADEV